MPITVLTNGLLKKRLQIANACAAKKGYEVIQKRNRGIPCKSDQKKVQLIFDLIDSIKEYISLIDGQYTCLINGVNDGIEFNDTGTCLSTNEIESILDKLCELCNAPCETYVDFEE